MRLLPIVLFLLPAAAHAETVRSVLASDQPGSLKLPIELTDSKVVAAACAEVAKRSPVDPEDESAEADLQQEKWDAERKLIFARVYRATIDPKSVRFDPYRVEDAALPISIQRSLPSLDGALLLSVMDREGAHFGMSAEEAAKMVERAEQKELRIQVTFQIDDQHAEEVSPCFSYPKSETWSLRVMPLRYELIDAGAASLASTSTERMSELGEMLEKKPADVEITARVVNGVVDQPALEKSIGEKRSAIGACLGNAGDTATFGLTARVAGGKLSDVRVEIEASDDPSAAACIAGALSGAAAPKASAGASVSVLVSMH
jgi:hypothetical protein